VEELVLSPSDFAALLNQTLEFAYPSVIIEGELSDFRVSKNRWVYFDLKDEAASIKFFGSVYNLPGPLEDGLVVRAVGSPRLHPRYGFSVNLQSLQPVGEGSLRKAADLLKAKLAAEGLFAPERKRPLPAIPRQIGLITAANSAAAADFMKILNERWGGVEILLADSLVQGPQAPGQLVAALEYFNKLARLPDVLVITRGGGSLDDLAAFNDERVVRSVAASRVPTLVAIGHEVDVSLAELAADVRASTPTNAAQLVVPDRAKTLLLINNLRAGLASGLRQRLQLAGRDIAEGRKYLTSQVFLQLKNAQNELISTKKLVALFDPQAALRRGYAIVSRGSRHVSKIGQVKTGDQLGIRLADGTINATATKILKG
jgi:exodeoxyribonuclease VII large subunit